LRPTAEEFKKCYDDNQDWFVEPNSEPRFALYTLTDYFKMMIPVFDREHVRDGVNFAKQWICVNYWVGRMYLKKERDRALTAVDYVGVTGCVKPARHCANLQKECSDDSTKLLSELMWLAHWQIIASFKCLREEAAKHSRPTAKRSDTSKPPEEALTVQMASQETLTLPSGLPEVLTVPSS